LGREACSNRARTADRHGGTARYGDALELIADDSLDVQPGPQAPPVRGETAGSFGDLVSIRARLQFWSDQGQQHPDLTGVL
jgi:hypothetical protein